MRSSGFIGPDRPPPPEAVRVAASRGIDLSGHYSRLITAKAVREADLIVVMDPRQRRRLHTRFCSSDREVLILGDLDPAPALRRAIQDPFGHPLEIFADVYDRIDRCVETLATAITARTGAEPNARRLKSV